MNLKLKLPLAFTAVLAALTGAALVGIHSLNRSITVYDTEVAANHAQERAVADMLVAFKTQVQEWKDTLLRGKDAAKLDKHWGAFAKQEAAVDDKARALLAVLPAGESHQLVDEAGETMTEIVASIARVTDILSEISAASSEQSAGVGQIGEAITHMDSATQQNAALVEESAAAAESLKDQAQQLVESVAVFRLAEAPAA